MNISAPVELIHTLTATESDFPMALGQCSPPVKRIFFKGRRERISALSRQPGLAIVGSRQATPQGLSDAEWFASELAQAGVTIISGLAQGIDAAAHRGGLAKPGGTIAVLGHGLDSVYPAHHATLAKDILDSGNTLISEYPEGVPALPHHFPCRNRIIAGLSSAVLVIEAAPKSGSLITARQALELGLDVYVLPGSIHEIQSIGSNYLIRQGAQLTQSPTQLLEDLGILAPSKTLGSRSVRDGKASSQSHLMMDLDPRASLILEKLSFAPTSLDLLAQHTQLGGGDLHAGLLLLEFSQLARRTPDGRWSLIRPHK
jgi:DNA processing protein